MSQLTKFINDQPDNRQRLLGLLNQSSQGSGKTFTSILTGKADCLASVWPDYRIPFFMTLTGDIENGSPVRVGDIENGSPVRVGDIENGSPVRVGDDVDEENLANRPPSKAGDDKGVRSHKLDRIFDIALAQQSKYPNLTRRPLDQLVDEVFDRAMSWEKEVSVEDPAAADNAPDERKMMVVPVNNQVLYRSVPKEFHSRLSDKWYHVTLAYKPAELGFGLGKLEVIGYSETGEGEFSWLTVRFCRQLPDGDYGPWELKNADGGNLHITLKAPFGKTGQIGKMEPTKMVPIEGSSPFRVVWCPVVKKRMDKGLTADHLQFFFDLDDTLVVVDRDTLDPNLLKGYNFLRSAEVMEKNTQPTPLLRAVVNSFPKIQVVTSRRLIEGQGSTLGEMESAFQTMMTFYDLPLIPVSLSFMSKKLVTYGAGDREMLKGVEKAKRVVGLRHTGAIPVHFDDSQGTITGLVSSGGVIGCHYNRRTFTFKAEQPKIENLPRHLVMGLQGMPGSGKSTILNKVAQRMRVIGRLTEVFSTDGIQEEGFVGPDTYKELEKRIKQALSQNKSVLVDTCLAGKGINSLKKRPSFLTHVIGWDTWGFESLHFIHCLESVITRFGHRLAIPGAWELLNISPPPFEEKGADLPEAMSEGPIKMEDNGPGLIEMTEKLKTIRDLQDHIIWMSSRNHAVKPRFLDGRSIEAYSPDAPIPSSTIITTEYVAEMKNLVEAYGREARGVSDVFWDGRFHRFKATFPIGPETGPNSTEKGRPRDSGYRDIAQRVMEGVEFQEEIHLSPKEDGECFGLSLNTGQVAKALYPWFDLVIQNTNPETDRGHKMLKEISRLVPGAILTISTRGTPGLGLTNTTVSLTSHVKMLYGFLAGVSDEMGVDPISVTVKHGFGLTIAHLKAQVIPMLQEALTSTEINPSASLENRGITAVMEVRQARRRCQFKDYTAGLQMMLAVEYPRAGYSFTGFNWHSSPTSILSSRGQDGGEGGTESGLYSFAPASTQADLLDKFELPYTAFMVTRRPDLVIQEFEELMHADEDRFGDKLLSFKSKFRGRFEFHPEGMVMMLRLLPSSPSTEKNSTRWVYLKLKAVFYYLAHAKNPDMLKLSKIPCHHREWFPLVRFQRSVEEADFEGMHREVRKAVRMVMLQIDGDRGHTHHKLVKRILDQKGTRSAFLALVNQRDVKYTGGELHHSIASVLVLSPGLSQLVQNHPIADVDQSSLDPLWAVVYRMIRFFGSEPLVHEVEEAPIPMTYDGLMARAEKLAFRHLARDVPMLFGR